MADNQQTHYTILYAVTTVDQPRQKCTISTA